MPDGQAPAALSGSTSSRFSRVLAANLALAEERAEESDKGYREAYEHARARTGLSPQAYEARLTAELLRVRRVVVPSP